MRTPPEMQSAWTEYWKTGAVESMPADRASGLLAHMDAAWNAFFAKLANGAKILDLATGGGSVVRAAVSQGREFEITGVDIADLSPVRATIQSGNVRLIGDTDLSSLPFADGAFDAVTSQFGFEYADVEAAAGEAVRVLTSGGQGHLVLHHADSAISHGDSSSLAAYRSVFAGSTAFQLGRTVFESEQQSASAEDIAAAITRFRNAVGELRPRLRADRSYRVAGNVVEFLMRLASSPSSYPAAEGLHQLETVEKFNEARNLRKAAQTKAALDRSGVDRVAAFLRAAGASVSEPQELRYTGGKLLAWSLLFQK
jgi:ubiquinone/menaquinone biosynthesis C-methylase UbiE